MEIRCLFTHTHVHTHAHLHRAIHPTSRVRKSRINIRCTQPKSTLTHSTFVGNGCLTHHHTHSLKSSTLMQHIFGTYVSIDTSPLSHIPYLSFVHTRTCCRHLLQVLLVSAGNKHMVPTAPELLAYRRAWMLFACLSACLEDNR